MPFLILIPFTQNVVWCLRVAELESREQHVTSREGEVEKTEVRLREEQSEMDIVRENMEFHKKSLLAAEEKIEEDKDK